MKILPEGVTFLGKKISKREGKLTEEWDIHRFAPHSLPCKSKEECSATQHFADL
jgi:hypothetical protein